MNLHLKRRGLRARILGFPRNTLLTIRLKRMLNRQDLIQDININEIRKKTLGYIESMRIKDGSCGLYRYSGSQKEPLLYASVYVVLLRHLYRDLDELSTQQKKEWANYIQSYQSEDGLFRDPLIECEKAEKSDSWGWRELTLHVIMALTALGAVVEKKFSFLEPFKNSEFIIKWLESREWDTDPAGVSNEVQNHATMLQYARDFQGEDWTDKALNLILDWLDNHQDCQTGLWGKQFDNTILLSQGVQAGYHIWLLYFYDKRPIKYMERIIDSCLRTQNRLGGFGAVPNSSACEDIDSIDPLVRFYHMTDYRQDEIKLTLQKAIPWVLMNMNKDGGFVFNRMVAYAIHPKMASASDESNVFATWFRTLSLAYLGKVLSNSMPGKFNWQFINCPGHQFYD